MTSGVPTKRKRDPVKERLRRISAQVKTDIRHQRRLGELVAGNVSMSSRVHVHVENKNGRFKRRIAVITVGASSFFDPREALRRQILASVDPDYDPRPVKVLDPTTVPATPPAEIRHAVARYIPWKVAKKRVPRGFLRAWARGGRRGWFFMYPDKIIHLTRTMEDGWVHRVVPPEGIS